MSLKVQTSENIGESKELNQSSIDTDLAFLSQGTYFQNLRVLVLYIYYLKKAFKDKKMGRPLQRYDTGALIALIILMHIGGHR